MRKIRIRTMKIEDIPSVAALERAVFSEPWSEDGFAAALAQSGNYFVAAVSEEDFSDDDLSVADDCGEMAEHSRGNVIGYCGLYTAADEGEITNVAVAEAYRCRGVGFALVDAVKERARQQGVCRIFLEVRASNRAAQSLYEKKDFKTVGTRKGFYRMPTEDALLMRCDL